MKKSNEKLANHHFLLAQEVYKSKSLQFVSAALLIIVLGLQIYQLLTINSLMQEAMETNVFFGV